MAGKTNGEKRLYWQDIVNRQADSGLSIRQFCAKEHVSEPAFYAWRRKLGGSGTSSRGVSSSSNGREFIPVQLLDSSGAVEVVHPLGYRIRVTGEVNITDLQRLLDVLDGRSDG